MIVLRFFFAVVLFCLSSSFFWDDEEKQLRQQYRAAETAFCQKKYAEAKEAYEKILARVDVTPALKYQVDWHTYVDIVFRYTEVLTVLEQYTESEKALLKLLAKNPPVEFLPKIRLEKARASAYTKASNECYKEMADVLLCYPQFPWTKEDLTFFQALEYSLDSYYDQLFHKAARVFACELYEEAQTLFEEIFEAIKLKYYPKARSGDCLISKKVRLRLAECYFNQAKYEQSLALCHEEEIHDHIDKEMIYLSALCYQAKQEYVHAVLLFERYVDITDRKNCAHYDHALFEIGLSFFKTKNFAQAKNHFERLISLPGEKSKPQIVGGFYLSKIYLKENEPEKAREILSCIANELPSSDPLIYECAYLQGKTAFQQGALLEAKRYFEITLSSQNSMQSWTLAALYDLGACHLALFERGALADVEKKESLEKAQKRKSINA